MYMYGPMQTNGTGIFTYIIYHKIQLNVGTYTIHGSNGEERFELNGSLYVVAGESFTICRCMYIVYRDI